MVQGASRGIGLALVEALAARPEIGRVVATSRDPDRSEGLRRLREALGDAIVLVDLDVREEPSIVAACARVRELAGPRLHWLINAAGILHDGERLRPEKRLEDLDPAALRTAFEINAFGPVLVAKHFLPLLRHDERAVFASLSARVGSIEDNHRGGWYGYRASKAAQNMFTRTLALECARRAPNVLCLALHPGTVETELSQPFRKNLPPERLFRPDDAARKLLAVADRCRREDSGRFFAWDGQPIPW